MNKPKVSVIIPNYNHARYLNKRIDSVLSQSFDDFEVIILDDSSTDNSKKIIFSYADNPKVTQVIINEQNSGSTFKQWQKGLSLSNGEWIWFAESDDYCEPTLLETLVKNAENCPNVVLSYCQSFYRQEGNEEVNHDMKFFTDQVDKQHWKQDYCIDGKEEIDKYLLHRCTIPNASAVLFKKAAYEQVDKSFVNMRLCGDWMLWVQLSKLGSVAFSATPLNHFRAHATTTRVMDSLIKRKRRAAEEYAVAVSIQKSGIVDKRRLAARLAEVSREYLHSFTTKELVTFLITPTKFEFRIPYREVVKAKISSFIARD